MKIVYEYSTVMHPFDMPITHMRLAIDTSEKASMIFCISTLRGYNETQMLQLTSEMCDKIEENITLYQLALETIENDYTPNDATVIKKVYIDSGNNNVSNVTVYDDNEKGVNIVDNFVEFLDEVFQNINVRLFSYNMSINGEILL